MTKARRAPETPALVALIITCNALPTLKRCLDSVKKRLRGIPHRVLVADDASRDGTRSFLKALSARGDLEAYLSPRNAGKAALLNILAKRAGPLPGWRLCLDDDAEITRSWASVLARNLPRYARASVIGCRNKDHAGLIHSAELVLATGWGHSERDLGQRSYTRFCDGVSGACMLVREDVSRSTRFDEALRQQMEDADFCLRVRKAGGKILYCGQAWIRHEHLHRNAPPPALEKNRRILSRRWKIPRFADSHPIDVLYGLAARRHKEKNWPAVLSAARKLAKADPAPYYACWLAGLALRNMGRRKEALSWWKKALGARYLNPLTRERMRLMMDHSAD
ncbi:MAG: glycosyltransferase [Elusimicrobia bacterium]|nr:glycosyltransferase [Elusimicrobiota bacterium]